MIMKHLLSTLAAAGLLIFGVTFCGCVHVPKPISPPASEKIAMRNNAASLLYSLLNDEKNVSKILIIKRDSAQLNQIIKAISTMTGSAAVRLTELAKADPALNLQTLELPVGEKAARNAVAKTKTHELLFSSGAEFEFNLLLTQAQALCYGSHLAKVAAENSGEPDQVKAFKAFEIGMNDLYLQVTAMMRGTPAK